MDKITHWWSRGLLNCVKAQIKVHNPHRVEMEPDKRYIIMCNHSSHYDIPLTFHALPGSIRMLAKKELFKIPLFGWTMRVCKFPSIDRKNKEQAIADLNRAKSLMDEGIRVWIAPEGTRSRDGKLAPFKKGGFYLAIESGAHILPITINGSINILPPKTWDFNTHEEVDIHISQPIDASQYTLENKEMLIKDVREAIEKNLKDV